MITPFLSLCVSLATFLTGIAWAIRQKCVYTFRAFDLNFYSYLIQARQAPNKVSRENYKTIAKQWLKRAEHIREDSVYTTITTMHLFLGMVMFSLSLIVHIFLQSFYWSLPFLLGTLFLLFSFATIILRYGYVKCFWFEKFSWKLGELIFPPLLHHLVLWDEIRELRDLDDELGNYLQSLPVHQTLKRLFGYSSHDLSE